MKFAKLSVIDDTLCISSICSCIYIEVVELVDSSRLICLVKEFSEKSSSCDDSIDELQCMEGKLYMTNVCSSFLAAVGLLDYLSYMASEGATSKSSPSDESIDELFTIFDDVRRTAVNITDTMLNFIGELLSLCSPQFTSIC